MAKSNSIKKTFDEQTPIVRLVIVVIALIIIFIVVKRAITWVKEQQTDSLKDPYSEGSPSRNVKPMVDNIYEHLNGYNLLVYPEYVNLITNLSDAELQQAYDYWQREYGTETQMSLTQFLEGEWDSGHYENAIEKLKRKGLL